MKKNILSLAVATSVAGAAVTAQAAMYLNPEGTGQVLLFPYYNAQNGNETSMHIVNTSATDAKAVKVRFLEYVNSQEVLDFNLYLSPKDHFSFTIFQQGDGGAIVTADNSCTVPELGTGSGDFGGTQTEGADGSIIRVQPFVNYAYGVGTSADNYSSITRSLVGHVEIIEMGVLENEDADLATAFNPAAWATHGSDGVPADCASLVKAWSTTSGVEGKWLDTDTANSEDIQVTAPTGGLYGVANMLNNSDAAAYGMEASAIADFWRETESHHEAPGDKFPSLAEGDYQSLIFNEGAAVALTYTDTTRVDAVSSLIMAKSIHNDVMADPALSGETDWVVTFPTRRYYVDLTAARLPFTDPYVGAGTTTGAGPQSSCETVSIGQTDREESITDPGSEGPQFSPEPPGDTPVAGPKLCYETNTIAINGVSALNASVSTDTTADAAVTLAWQPDQPAGWQTITFGSANKMTDANGKVLDGLPVVGFAAFEYTNGSKNFGFVSDHKTTVTGSGI